MTRLTYILPYKPGDRVLTRSALGDRPGTVKSVTNRVVRVRLNGTEEDIILPARLIEKLPSAPETAA